MSHAKNPDPRRRTADRRPRRGRSSPCCRSRGTGTARGRPAIARTMFRAACAPPCFATCATPGSGSPVLLRTRRRRRSRRSPGARARQRRLGQHAPDAIERHAERRRRAATPRRRPPTARSRAAMRSVAEPHAAARRRRSRARPVRTSTPSRSSDARAACRSGLGKRRRARAARPRARRMRADSGWIGRKFVAERLPRDLGERAGQLDAGRAAADDDERQQAAPRVGIGLTLGASNASSTRRRISSASSRVLSPGARAPTRGGRSRRASRRSRR